MNAATSLAVRSCSSTAASERRYSSSRSPAEAVPGNALIASLIMDSPSSLRPEHSEHVDQSQDCPRGAPEASGQETQGTGGPCDHRDPDHTCHAEQTTGLRLKRGHGKPELASCGSEQANQSVTLRRDEAQMT